MNPVEAFASLCHRQFVFLRDCHEFDDLLLDLNDEQWNRRNGPGRVTRQDINRREWFRSIPDEPLPSVIPHCPKRCGTRLKTALRIFALHQHAQRAQKEAMVFCRTRPEFAVHEPALIQKFWRLHWNWLAAVRRGIYDEQLEIEHEWKASFRELDSAARAIEETDELPDAVEEKSAAIAAGDPPPDPVTDALAKLSPESREATVLVAMLEGRMTGPEARHGQEEILRKALGKDAWTNDHRRVFRRLVELRLVALGENRRGYYLTATGQQAAQRLRK